MTILKDRKVCMQSCKPMDKTFSKITKACAIDKIFFIITMEAEYNSFKFSRSRKVLTSLRAHVCFLKIVSYR